MVLIHDDEVDRTTNGTGDIRSLSADAALNLDAGSWFTSEHESDNEFAGTRIPLLTDLLALVTGDRRILLEIKGDHTSEQLTIMLQQIHGAGCDERVFLQSFEVPVLERLRVLVPQDPIGLLVETIHNDPVAECRRLGATVYNPHFAELLRRPGLVAELHSAGIATTPWTSDSPDDWATLTNLGVDGIITNRPDELVAWQADSQAARADG